MSLPFIIAKSDIFQPEIYFFCPPQKKFALAHTQYTNVFFFTLGPFEAIFTPIAQRGLYAQKTDCSPSIRMPPGFC